MTQTLVTENKYSKYRGGGEEIEKEEDEVEIYRSTKFELVKAQNILGWWKEKVSTGTLCGLLLGYMIYLNMTAP